LEGVIHLPLSAAGVDVSESALLLDRDREVGGVLPCGDSKLAVRLLVIETRDSIRSGTAGRHRRLEVEVDRSVARY